MLTAGDRSPPVPGGATVPVPGNVQDDGSCQAVAVVAEQDGVKPPM